MRKKLHSGGKRGIFCLSDLSEALTETLHPIIKTIMKPTKWNLLILPASLLMAGLSHAALISYDGFDYGSPGGDLTGKNGGTGWSGAYTDVGNSTVYTTTGLTYTGLSTTGGAVNTNDGSGTTTISFRGFSAISTGETWISFLAQRNGTASNSTFAGVNFYNSTGTASTDSEFLIGNGGGTDPNRTWRLTDSGGAVTDSTTTVIASDTTYLMVAQILWGAGTGGTDSVSLFINPALGSTPVAADANLDIDMSNIDKVRIAGSGAVDYTFDELRIGTTFASVTVPEPSAVFLGGLGMLVLLRRRRA